jgi:hypothetical protein
MALAMSEAVQSRPAPADLAALRRLASKTTPIMAAAATKIGL